MILLAAGAPAAPQQNEVIAPRTVHIDDEARVVAFEERLRALEQQSAALDGRLSVSDQAYSRFENEISSFGILITLLVLGFGFITHRGAVNAARYELSELRDKVESLHEEAVNAKEEALKAAMSARDAAASAEAASRAAQGAAEGARAHEQTAEQASEKVKEAAAVAERWRFTSMETTDVHITAEERETVQEAAKEVDERSEREWDIDEFKVKVFQANERQDWREAIRLARGMQFLHGNSVDAVTYGLFQEGRALIESGRYAEAVSVYDQFVRETQSDNSENRALNTITGQVNKLIAFCFIGKWTEAVSLSDDIIEACVGKEGRGFLVMAIKAYSQRGMALVKLDRVPDAIRSFESALREFGLSGDKATDTTFHYNYACTLALSGKVSETIAILETWRRMNKSFDCLKIEKDKDFDLIRADPQFIAYLKKQGCSDGS
ncbi:MAG TPA: hypothetical protein VD887_06450 [Allosphingosinicella sp.]|nr:hypothetical protein [Allosphingosinicella sp.]